ncbi:protein of unknown function [Streptomyces murinus]
MPTARGTNRRHSGPETKTDRRGRAGHTPTAEAEAESEGRGRNRERGTGTSGSRRSGQAAPPGRKAEPVPEAGVDHAGKGPAPQRAEDDHGPPVPDEPRTGSRRESRPRGEKPLADAKVGPAAQIPPHMPDPAPLSGGPDTEAKAARTRGSTRRRARPGAAPAGRTAEVAGRGGHRSGCGGLSPRHKHLVESPATP